MFKYLLLIPCLLALTISCADKQSPRGVTMEFVGSVIEGDSLAIEKLLDVDMMVDRRMKMIPPVDSIQTHEYFRDAIIRNLTGNGGTRAFWKSILPVVNEEKVDGDTAHVELTLMNQTSGAIQYLMVDLYHGKSGWRVFQFL
jgi:hypothetical protein